MPFVDIRLAGTELSTENYGSGGILLADRPAHPAQEVASADGKR